MATKNGGITEQKKSLADLINRGGIYRDVQGNNPREVLSALIGVLPPISSVSADKLLEAVLEREALMPTGIGRGIALPHPRNPLDAPDPSFPQEGQQNPLADSEQFAVLAFLKEPVDWHSLDGEKVHILFLIVSASAKQHLQNLSEITFLCHQEDFCRLLNERASQDRLLHFIREAEKDWN